MARRRHPAPLRALLSLLVVCLAASPGAAEIYRWTDASGQVHFTQDLGKVPPEHRRAAEAAAHAPRGRDRIQVYDAPARVAPRSRAGSASGAGKVHRIRVERAGTSMVVQVTLNGSVTAPFILDTGASDVLVPKWVADELGLDLTGPEVRTRRYRTANGIVESPAVVLDSVRLGTAEARQVHGSVSDRMEVGLLGLAFFNHFNYQVRPELGLVTLEENGMAEEGLIRGGRSEAQWRAEYRNLRYRIEAARELLNELPDSRVRRKQATETDIAKLEQQLEILEDEADDARVPIRWRE